jgi:hypothetical protein
MAYHTVHMKAFCIKKNKNETLSSLYRTKVHRPWRTYLTAIIENVYLVRNVVSVLLSKAPNTVVRVSEILYRHLLWCVGKLYGRLYQLPVQSSYYYTYSGDLELRLCTCRQSTVAIRGTFSLPVPVLYRTSTGTDRRENSPRYEYQYKVPYHRENPFGTANPSCTIP